MHDFRIDRLAHGDDRPSFDCGVADLNEFFSTDSKKWDGELLSVTYVATKDNNAIAFFSVSNDSIKKEDIPRSAFSRVTRSISHRKRYSSTPAVKIGRLATCVDMQGKGIGTQILDYIKVWFTDGNKTGCRIVTIDAYNNDQTINFYEKNGFTFLTDDDKEDDTRLMYFDLFTFIQ